MLLCIPELKNHSIKHFFTTRKFSFDETTPFGSKDMFVTVNQAHGDDLYIIDKSVEKVTGLIKAAAQTQADAIITNQRHIGIGVVTADCVPALIYDPVQSVIAAVHAGWKGTVKGILSKVICQMAYRFNCSVEDSKVGIGPSIGACCYAVGEIVTEPLKSTNPEWGRYLKPDEDGKAKLDLAALNIRQIEDAGVLTKNIFNLGLCTSCNGELFFSYRRDGVGTGRMLSGIMMN